MRNVRRTIFIISSIICLPAFAYIDPASGSAIMSLIIGFFVTLGLVLKTYWYKFKALFSRAARPSEKSDTDAEKSE